jgi:hypothetical protein
LAPVHLKTVGELAPWTGIESKGTGNNSRARAARLLNVGDQRYNFVSPRTASGWRRTHAERRAKRARLLSVRGSLSLLDREERFCLVAVLCVPLGGTNQNGAAQCMA